MSGPQRQQEQLVVAACSLPRAEREAFLRQNWAGDEASLEKAVAHVLQASIETTGDHAISLETGEKQLLSGVRIDGYEIGGLIGQGGMGSVYEGRQKSPQRRVAIKVMSDRSLIDAKSQLRFDQEANVLGRLNHPNIVTVYHYVRQESAASLVMEYVAGRDGGPPTVLSELMNGDPLDPVWIRDLMLQLTSAMAYAHKSGIIHRDLKPSNILITEHDQPKIVDFGIALLNIAPGTKLTTGGMFLGTLAYASPEQRNHSGAVSEQSDIYSLGVVLYQMLTGLHPEGAFEVPSEIREGLSESWDEIVRKALNREPANRFRTMTEFHETVKRIGTRTHSSEQALQGLATPTVVQGARCEQELTDGHADLILTLAFSPDGNALATGGIDGAVKYWNLQTGEAIVSGQHEGRVGTVAIDPLGRWCASGGYDHSVRLWPLTDEANEFCFHEHWAPVSAVAFDARGATLTACSGNRFHSRVKVPLARKVGWRNRIQLWHIEDSSFVSSDGEHISAWNVYKKSAPSLGLRRVFQSYFGLNWIRPIGARGFVAAGADDALVWTYSGSRLETLWSTRNTDRSEADISECLAVAGDLKRALFLGVSGSCLVIVSLKQRTALGTFLCNAEIRAAAVTSDWSRVVAATNDSAIHIWDVSTARELGADRVNGIIDALTLSPDNVLLAYSAHNEGSGVSSNYRVVVRPMPD